MTQSLKIWYLLNNLSLEDYFIYLSMQLHYLDSIPYKAFE